MSGRVVIVGLGPGAAELLTLQAEAALADVTDLVGYGPYVDRVLVRDGQVLHVFDNGEELPRAHLALRLAASGRAVAVVSAGDAGVFAMAAAVFEAIETGEPGVAAAGHDRGARHFGDVRGGVAGGRAGWGRISAPFRCRTTSSRGRWC